MALHVLGTCISPMVSSHPAVNGFGAAALLSFIASYLLYETWFISVWCFFAALLSAIVLLHVRARPLASRKEVV